MTTALTLLTHGGPLRALVAACGLDERTAAAWQEKAGRHAQRFHELRIERGQVQAAHVQADELWAKMVARKVWMALALAVETRLWLGGRISRRRDGAVITAPVRRKPLAEASLSCSVAFWVFTPGGSRTPNLRIRSPTPGRHGVNATPCRPLAFDA
jgi:hypothetical protein